MPRLSLVSALLLCLLLDQTVGISLPSIFGTRVTKDDVKKDEVKEDVAVTSNKEDGEKDEHHHEHHPVHHHEHHPEHHHEHHKPTRPPIIFNIPHPADHPLHPHNRPDHPLHPDNLPHLPHLELPHLELPHLELPHLELPHLPPLHEHLPHIHEHLQHHFPRETIHATKTVFVEVTDRVTVHPICMTAAKGTPACLPHHHEHEHHEHHEHHERDEVQDREGVQDFAINPTAAPELFSISPTATAMAGNYLNLEPTRIFGGEYISESSPSPSEPADLVDGVDELDSQGGNRDGRWVRLTPPIKEEPGKLKDDQPTEEPAPAENSGHTPLDMVHHLIHRPVIKYKTKTLWVTKVEKVLDTRVTATMEAKNCVPVNSHFPFCEHHEVEHHHGYHHHGYHHHGLHGGFHIGGVLSTNKVDGGVDEEAEESESQAVVVEAPAEVESEKLEDIESQVVETTEREVEVEDDRVEESNVEQVAE